MTLTHGWASDPALFVALHLPERARLGVVICPPLAQEGVGAYRALRVVAEQLEARGIAAVRFDPPGRGESAPVAPGELLGGARTAAGLLRAAGCTAIAYLGLASGALASCAAAEPGDLLVLWDAPMSGRAWLRRQRSLATLTLGADRVADGVETIIGMDLEAEDAAAISAAPVAVPEGVRALALVRRGDPAPDGIAEAIEVDGMDELLGVSSMISRVPTAAIRALADRLAAEAESESASGSDSAALVAPPLASERRAAGIVESIVHIGPHALFGIETAPDALPADAPAVLLHNGASEHRVGAADYQVQLARRLAADGVRVLRVDRRATGESGELGPDPDDLMFTREWIEDQDAMIAALDVPGDRLAIAGLCVGAWMGSYAAPYRPRLIIGISQDVFRPRPAPRNEVVEFFRRIDRVSPARKRARAIWARFAPHALQTAVRTRYGRGDLAAHFTRVAEAGVPTVLLLAPLDVANLDGVGGEAALRALGGAIEVTPLGAGDHSLFGRGIREHVMAEIRERVANAFATPAD